MEQKIDPRPIAKEKAQRLYTSLIDNGVELGVANFDEFLLGIEDPDSRKALYTSLTQAGVVGLGDEYADFEQDIVIAGPVNVKKKDASDSISQEEDLGSSSKTPTSSDSLDPDVDLQIKEPSPEITLIEPTPLFTDDELGTLIDMTEEEAQSILTARFAGTTYNVEQTGLGDALVIEDMLGNNPPITINLQPTENGKAKEMAKLKNVLGNLSADKRSKLISPNRLADYQEGVEQYVSGLQERYPDFEINLDTETDELYMSKGSQSTTIPTWAVDRESYQKINKFLYDNVDAEAGYDWSSYVENMKSETEDIKISPRRINSEVYGKDYFEELIKFSEDNGVVIDEATKERLSRGTKTVQRKKMNPSSMTMSYEKAQVPFTKEEIDTYKHEGFDLKVVAAFEKKRKKEITDGLVARQKQLKLETFLKKQPNREAYRDIVLQQMNTDVDRENTALVDGITAMQQYKDIASSGYQDVVSGLKGKLDGGAEIISINYSDGSAFQGLRSTSPVPSKEDTDLIKATNESLMQIDKDWKDLSEKISVDMKKSLKNIEDTDIYLDALSRNYSTFDATINDFNTTTQNFFMDIASIGLVLAAEAKERTGMPLAVVDRMALKDIEKQKRTLERQGEGFASKLSYTEAMAMGRKGEFAAREFGTQSPYIIAAIATAGAGGAMQVGRIGTQAMVGGMFGLNTAGAKYDELTQRQKIAVEAKAQLEQLETMKGQMPEGAYAEAKYDLERSISANDISNSDKTLAVTGSGIIEGLITGTLGTAPNALKVVRNIKNPNQVVKRMLQSNYKATQSALKEIGIATGREIVEETSIEALTVLNDAGFLGDQVDFSMLDDVAITSIITSGGMNVPGTAYSTLITQAGITKFKSQIKQANDEIKDLKKMLTAEDLTSVQRMAVHGKINSLVKNIANDMTKAEADVLLLGSDNVKEMLTLGGLNTTLLNRAGVEADDNYEQANAKVKTYITSLPKEQGLEYRQQLEAIDQKRKDIVASIDYTEASERVFGDKGAELAKKVKPGADAEATYLEVYKKMKGQIQEAAVNEFVNADTKEKFVAKIEQGQWGMLTAENPNATAATAEANAEANIKAEAWLKEKGYKAEAIKGKYGVEENSFFVEDLTTEDAIAFAKEFNQESVATDKGLVYQDGSMNPRVGQAFDVKQDDFFSTKETAEGAVTFAVEYDFDTKVGSKGIADLREAFDTASPELLQDQAEKAQRAISWALPGLEIIMLGQEQYDNATAMSGSVGKYVQEGRYRAIFINADKADKRTIAHEVFHAILLDGAVDEKEVKRLTDQMLRSISKVADVDLVDRIAAFSEKYDRSIRSEEALAELFGILASEYRSLPQAQKNIIQQFFEDLAMFFGLKKMTDREVIDFMNYASKKVSEGVLLGEMDTHLPIKKTVDNTGTSTERNQAQDLFVSKDKPKLESTKDVAKFLQGWVEKNKVFDDDLKNIKDSEIVDKYAEHLSLELKAWEGVRKDDYISFYDTDISSKTNPMLQEYAVKEYGRPLEDTEVKLFHLVSAFASPSANPALDSWKGFDIFDRFMKTGELSGYSDKIATIWKTLPGGRRVDTGVEKRDSEGNKVRSKVTPAFSQTGLDKFNLIIEKTGDLDAAMSWITSEYTYKEISDMLEYPDKGPKAMKENEYVSKDNKSLGIFGMTGAKLGSYVLNRFGNFSTVTKDMWYARTMARLSGQPLVDVNKKTGKESAIKTPWAESTKEGRRMRSLADKAFKKVADEFNTEPAIIQERIWDFEKRLYEMLGASENAAYTSDGLKQGIERSRDQKKSRPTIDDIKKYSRDNNISPEVTRQFLEELGYTPEQINDDGAKQAQEDALAKFDLSRKRGNPYSQNREAAIEDLKKSQYYQVADDTGRENAIRDLKIALDEKPKRAPSVKKILGKADKKVTVSEYAALKAQIRLEARAAREAKVDINTKRKLLAKYVEDLKKVGVLTVNQAKVIINRISGVNLDSETSVTRFIEYMDKVYADAAMADRILQSNKKRKSAFKNVKRKIGSAPALMAPLSKLFSIDSKLIPSGVLDAYSRLVDEFSGRQSVLDIRKSPEILEDVNKVFEAIDVEVNQIPQLALTFNSLRNEEMGFTDSVNDLVSQGMITAEEGELMKKYKKDIVEKTEAEAPADPPAKFEIKSNDVSDPIERKAAQRLIDLVNKAGSQIAELGRSELMNLQGVLDNINAGYFSAYGMNLSNEIESIIAKNEVAPKISKKPSITIDRAIGAMKHWLQKSKMAVEYMIRQSPLYDIDTVLGNHNSKVIYNNTFGKVGKAYARMTTELDAVTESLLRAEAIIARQFKNNPNSITDSKFRQMLFLLQKEFEANPESNQVFSAHDAALSVIKNYRSVDRYNKSEADALQRIIDTFSLDQDGALGRLESSFSAREKEALAIVEKVNESLQDKFIHTAAIVRGSMPPIINSYVHHSVVQRSDDAIDTVTRKYNNFRSFSTKAGTVIERTGGVKPLNLDPITSTMTGARETLTDYYMTSPVKTVFKTLNKLKSDIDNNENSTEHQKDIVESLVKTFEDATRITFSNDFKSDDIKMFNHLRALGYKALLASIPRAFAELSSNMGYVTVGNGVEFFGRGIGRYAKRSIAHNSREILKNVGSEQTGKLYQKKVTGKSVDLGLFPSEGNFKGTHTRGAIANKIEQIRKYLSKATYVPINKVADALISTPDRMISRPLWFGAFSSAFNGETGVEPNFDKIQDNDAEYMRKHKDAIDSATKYADIEVTRAATSVNPYNSILKNKVEPGRTANRMIKEANGFMTNFIIYEYTTARAAMYALVNNGDISKVKAARLLGATGVRMSSYYVMYQLFVSLFDMAASGALGLDLEEDEIDLEELFMRQLAGSGMQLFLGRNLGNIARVPIAMGTEIVNDEYFGFLRSDKDYDPYDHGLFYSPMNKEQIQKGKVAESLAYLFTGPYSPLLKTLIRSGTVIGQHSTAKKQSTKDKKIHELKHRTTMEILGNLGMVPLYKDVRRIALKKMFEDYRKPKKGKKKARDFSDSGFDSGFDSEF